MNDADAADDDADADDDDDDEDDKDANPSALVSSPQATVSMDGGKLSVNFPNYHHTSEVCCGKLVEVKPGSPPPADV